VRYTTTNEHPVSVKLRHTACGTLIHVCMPRKARCHAYSNVSVHLILCFSVPWPHLLGHSEKPSNTDKTFKFCPMADLHDCHPMQIAPQSNAPKSLSTPLHPALCFATLVVVVDRISYMCRTARHTVVQYEYGLNINMVREALIPKLGFMQSQGATEQDAVSHTADTEYSKSAST
jgi:hypothetical protein